MDALNAPSTERPLVEARHQLLKVHLGTAGDSGTERDQGATLDGTPPKSGPERRTRGDSDPQSGLHVVTFLPSFVRERLHIGVHLDGLGQILNGNSALNRIIKRTGGDQANRRFDFVWADR